MINKALRILIADPQHFHRMKIERIFNSLGYYRVAPVHSLNELLRLVDFGSEPFDVLVIDAGLAAGRLDLHGFLADTSQIRHALVYNDAVTGHDAMPSACAIEQLMVTVERSTAADPLDLPLRQRA